jgi:hypothetical protein
MLGYEHRAMLYSDLEDASPPTRSLAPAFPPDAGALFCGVLHLSAPVLILTQGRCDDYETREGGAV